MIFDGPTKLISLGASEHVVEAAEIYSRWKEWVISGEGAQFPPAFSSSGAEPVGGGLLTGPVVLLLNGWRIRPDEADHHLTINGNLYAAAGADITTPPLGEYTVTVQIERSVNAALVESDSSYDTLNRTLEDLRAIVLTLRY